MPAQTHLAYLDCFSGISGDMFLAALLHAGVDQEQLLGQLHGLKGLDFELRVEEQSCSGIGCRQLTVHSASGQQFRHLGHILALLNDSSLPQEIIQRASAIFDRLARAEALVHNCALEEVHFHEVGAVDTLVDIVGVLLGLSQLGVTRVVCSPLPLGRGFVDCAHGRLPLPAPAVSEILCDVPVYGVEQDKELVTPTGAALAVGVSQDFGPMPAMTIERVGYGAGSHRLKGGQANLLRLLLGTGRQVAESQEVEIIETHLDDWNSEGFPYLCDLLFAAQALDVSLSPLLMKKGRPGQLLRVICAPAHALALKRIILSETTAIGLRFHREQRMTLPREVVQVSTPWGKIQAKRVETPAGSVIYPEYEACCAMASKHSVPLARIYQSVDRTPRS